MAKNPGVFVNVTEFSLNFQSGMRRGAKLQPPGRPVGTTLGAYFGRGLGFALGVGRRAVGLADDLLGPGP